MKRKSKEVAAYFQALTPERREALEAVKALILEPAPGVEETMRYRMPTYEYSDGDMLCALASQKQYMSLYMDPPVVEQYREELQGLSVGKSCIRFRKLEALPTIRIACVCSAPTARARSIRSTYSLIEQRSSRLPLDFSLCSCYTGYSDSVNHCIAITSLSQAVGAGIHRMPLEIQVQIQEAGRPLL